MKYKGQTLEVLHINWSNDDHSQDYQCNWVIDSWKRVETYGSTEEEAVAKMKKKIDYQPLD